MTKVYYHGTTEARAQKILRTGLRPSYSQREDEPQKFAFLSESKDNAAFFGSRHGKPGTVLEVKPHPYFDKQLRKDLGEFTRSPKAIPPNMIKRI